MQLCAQRIGIVFIAVYAMRELIRSDRQSALIPSYRLVVLVENFTLVNDFLLERPASVLLSFVVRDSFRHLFLQVLDSALAFI